MKSVTLRFEREGGKRGVLEQGRRYLLISGSDESRPFDMPIGHEECLNYLGDLRYERQDEHPLHWPARPRVLFAHASPDWIDAPDVPASDHKKALQNALRPWFDPIEDPNMVLGDDRTVLTELKDATIEEIGKTCQEAADEGRPFTHIHLLAHGCEITAGAAGRHYGLATAPDVSGFGNHDAGVLRNVVEGE